jgi:hypothetical protein
MAESERSQQVDREPEIGERRTCSGCGQQYFLPLDGDPTRRCPHCDISVEKTIKGDLVLATLDAVR